MPPRIAPLNGEPITFAHRGARADAPENTLEAFGLALELGATGLESDVWLTVDGIAVLDHDGQFGRFRNKRRVAEIARADLPAHVPSLEDLYRRCGGGYELSLDVKTPDAAAVAVATARRLSDELGEDLCRRLWLCHPDLETLESWRSQFEEVRLVHSTRLRVGDQGSERHAAALARAKVDAVNMHQSEWTGGLVVLFHRFEVAAFGWDAQYERMLLALFDMGADGVYSDHVARMVTAFDSVHGRSRLA